MNLELSDDDVQTVINALAELPAKISYNTLTKVVQQQQVEQRRRAEGAYQDKHPRAVPFEPDAA
jgi:alcohol dehydrogenase class IV